jgi:hypothetical protein
MPPGCYGEYDGRRALGCSGANEHRALCARANGDADLPLNFLLIFITRPFSPRWKVLMRRFCKSSV